MNLSVLKDPALYRLLLCVDAELVELARSQGCPYCAGKLHDGGFARKPKGCPKRFLTPEFCWRTSLDCSVCRRRTLTPSVRFLGPKTYIGAVLVLVDARGCPSASALTEELGVPERTVDRWRHWWRTVFVKSALWRNLRGRLARALEPRSLPAALLERVQATESVQRLIRCLRLLAPLGMRASA